jgi:hypothetical protein
MDTMGAVPSLEVAPRECAPWAFTGDPAQPRPRAPRAAVMTKQHAANLHDSLPSFKLAGWHGFIAPARVEWNVRRLILLCRHFLVLLKREAALVLG